VLEDVIDLLDRQLAFLLRQSGTAFFEQLAPYVETLRSEPRIEALIEDLKLEALTRRDDFVRHDEEATEELARLREELAGLAPEYDDSALIAPTDLSASRAAYDFSYANFDRVASLKSEIGFPTSRGRGRDPSRTGALINILRAKVHEATTGSRSEIAEPRADSPVPDEFHRRFGNLIRRHEAEYNRFALASRSMPGLSALRLERIVEQGLQPEPEQIEADEAADRFIERQVLLAFTDIQLVRTIVFGTTPPDGDETRRADELENELRVEAERLHEELRRRLGTTRSHLALVQRFKARCERHDSARLREVVAAHPTTPEDALTGELARYLFDAGLSPITRPLIGDLEPDLLDPFRPTLYVEAKQYADGHARRTIISGARQAWDTVGRLRPGPYEVTEIFFVIFRRSGPRYALPDFVRSEGISLYPILIDITPASESGSQQRRQPRAITSEDLGPLHDDADA
jgi:hypothetical protein